MHWQQLSSDLCWNNEHTHLEIGVPGLDIGNSATIVMCRHSCNALGQQEPQEG